MAVDTGPVVIIGFGPGVSAAVAEAFARQGRPLVLLARDGEKLERARAGFAAAGVRAAAEPTDAADPAALEAALERAKSPFGDPDVLLYNAAAWRPGPVLDLSPRDFEADLRVGIVGALAAARAFAPAMAGRGRGSLLFTGGGFALHPSPVAPSLSVAKAGIRALALMLAQELAPRGVRVGTVTIVGTVAPGTPFAPEKIAEAFLRLHASPPDPATAEIVFHGA